MTMTITITELADLQLLNSSITGYRNANADLDQAFKAGNWGAIEGVQNLRAMHSTTIALIVNKFADTATEGAHS